MTLTELKALKNAGRFHHATYRNFGTIHEGLWIYERDPNGFRGFDLAGAFLKENPELDAAQDLLHGTGVSVGSYGNG